MGHCKQCLCYNVAKRSGCALWGTNKKTMKRVRIIVGFIFAIGLVGLMALPSNAAENANGTGSVAGYSADRPLDDGTIVVLQDSKNSKVKAATQSQVQNMFGVTVDPNQLTLRISNGEMQNEVFVAVSVPMMFW